MNRRNFILKLLAGLKTMTLLSVLPPSSIAAVAGKQKSENMHYKPLNGRSLKDIAFRKLHHGSDGHFVNPIGVPRHGRLWQVMHWKLFHQNKFKKYFDGEQVKPVSIDWGSIRRHRGLSITFLKHASVMIKDIHRYILIDPVFSDIFWFIKDFTPLNFNLKQMPKYEPRWFMAPSHINPRETVNAFRQLKAKKLLIVHWGTFRLGDEPVHFPPMQIRKELEQEGLSDRLVDLTHGETYYPV